MELHDLKPAVGSNKKKSRIGRGPGSGKGGTSTRGHKGAKSRSGYKEKVGFEGGQMPLQRRVPKGGFKNINRVEYKAINVAVLEELADKNGLEKITVADLLQAGLVRKNQLIKILGQGQLNHKVEVEAHAFSKKAEEIITAAGGSIVKL
ncbi:MAG: 50S ribosomal protein L15 [Muribaculaceae bacterium]|nr:50S ribosomal protein L15 [Muribaculaceae bacterium]